MPRRHRLLARLASGVLVLGWPAAAAAQRAVNPLPALPVTPRFSGLGDASSAMIGYAGSVFTNPAGIAAVKVMSLEGAYARVTDSSAYYMAAGAVRLGPANLGGGIRYLRFDEQVDLNAALESTVAVVSRVKGVALGAAADYFSVEDSAGAIARTLTSDLAVTVAFFDIAALAVTAQNVGRTGFGGPGLDLPSAISLGFSLNLIDTYSNGRLLATIERVWLEGDGATRFGLEGGAVFYGVGLVARAGTGPRLAGSTLTSRGVGGSLVLGRAAIDYAYRERVGQPPLHLVGLRLTL